MTTEQQETEQRSEIRYRPRPHFIAFHKRSQRRAVLVCHRRAGKTEAAIYDLLDKASKIKWDHRKDAPPFYAYVAPYLNQARTVVWNRLVIAAKQIPGTKITPSRLEIVLNSGATIKLFGADDVEALRGLYFDGVILDECGDIKREFWKTIHYGLLDYKGWAVFMGTPKGKNSFYRRLQEAQSKPDRWFHLVLKASESNILTQDEVDEIIEECDGDEDMVAQELECSFEAAIKGSYYGKHVVALKERGQVKEAIPFDPYEPVSLAMDIGYSDATSIWFWQVVNGSVRYIKYFEESGCDADDIVEMLQMLPYRIDTVWLPHDSLHKTFRSKKSVMDVFREANLPARRVPNPDEGNRVFHGINAVRRVLKTWPIEFDSKETNRGIECLLNYSHKWNPKTETFADEPSHDQWSHGADAFRYACLAITTEDLARSRERWSKRALDAQKGINSLPKPNIGRNPLTWNDHLAHHDRMQERYARANRW